MEAGALRDPVCETARLILRRLSADDGAFILELLNEPSFIQNIGDRGVRTLDDARRYIQNGPVASYARHGFGLYLVELKEAPVPIGLCGFVKRDALEDVDIGFAFLPRFWSQGYAFESADAVMAFGRESLGLRRVVAIVAPHNQGSIKLLGKLGLVFERSIKLPGDSEEISLFAPPG